MEIKIGSKKSGAYIDFIKNNIAAECEILARGSNTSKAVYVVAVMTDLGYHVSDFHVESQDIGKREPLAVLKIVLRANDDNLGRREPG